MTKISNVPDELKALQKLKEGTKKTEENGDLFKQTFDKVLSNTDKQPVATSSLPPLGEIGSINASMPQLISPGVGEKTALAIAAPIGPIGGSPTPVGSCPPVSTKIASTVGASFIVKSG